MTAPLLVVGLGNPSRGDDALGPAFVERATALLEDRILRGEIELLTDFQLQIEHAMDLEGRARVVFVDASVGVDTFELSRVSARAQRSHTTHAMSPEALLATYRDVLGEPPAAWVLAIGGDRFELGEPLSSAARANLDAAVRFFVAEVQNLTPPVGQRAAYHARTPA